MSTAPRTAGVVALGVAATAVTASRGGFSAADALFLGGIAFGVGAVVLLVGLAALRRLSNDSPGSVWTRTIVVAAIPVISLLAGCVAAAKVMFVSAHDLNALNLVIVGAGTAGVLGAFALADQLVNARQRLVDSLDRQARLERSRRELVAWVSHDLRTPLAGMRAMSEALADGVVADQESVDRYHQNLVRESERLARLVDDLFELSRLQVDQVHLALEQTSLGDLVSDAVASATALADAKGVALVGEVHGTTPVLNLSAPEMLRVMHNLLDNAIRHTPPGGRVEVLVSSDNSDGVISVLDECGGIDADQAERVFELAFRGDEARSPGDVGGGFGLAIARGLVEAHGGRIDHHNEGPGCRFTVRLPVTGIVTESRDSAGARDRTARSDSTV